MSNFTYDEICTQSEALQRTLEIMMDKKVEAVAEDKVYLFTGCGTSYYLALAAARFFQAVTKKPAMAVPASEIFMNPEQIFVPNQAYKMIVISRSGTTSEVISALKFLDGKDSISTLAVTCKEDSEMVKIAGDSIVLDHINEKSVVMTQSFSCMYYALQLFAAKVLGNQVLLNELKTIPSFAGQIFKQTDAVKKIADNLNYKRFIFLGSGLYNGLACEGTLKLKEMTQTECETYSKLEFRHGPISIVDEHTVAILLSEEKTKELDHSLSQDIQAFGGYTVAIGNYVDSDAADQTIYFGTSLSDYASSVLAMPFLQMLAYYRAVRLGLNPDQPKNLNQVVKTSLPY